MIFGIGKSRESGSTTVGGVLESRDGNAEKLRSTFGAFGSRQRN